MTLDYLKRTWSNHVEAFRQSYGMDSTLSALVDLLALGVSAWFLYTGTGPIFTAVCVFAIVLVVVDRGRRLVGRFA